MPYLIHDRSNSDVANLGHNKKQNIDNDMKIMHNEQHNKVSHIRKISWFLWCGKLTKKHTLRIKVAQAM
jgi:proline racemase